MAIYLPNNSRAPSADREIETHRDRRIETDRESPIALVVSDERKTEDRQKDRDRENDNSINFFRRETQRQKTDRKTDRDKENDNL